MKTVENNFDDIKVNELLKKHFIELRSVSPAGSTHVLDIDGLKNETIKFWSIWGNKDLIGCGAIKILSTVRLSISPERGWPWVWLDCFWRPTRIQNRLVATDPAPCHWTDWSRF